MNLDPILEFLSTKWWMILAGIVLIIAAVKLLPRYKIAPPDTALIISGLLRRSYKVRNPDGTVSAKKFGYRIVRGGATFYIPAIERIDQLDMCLMQVDIKTAQPVPTKEYISVVVDAVANIKIGSDDLSIAKDIIGAPNGALRAIPVESSKRYVLPPLAVIADLVAAALSSEFQLSISAEEVLCALDLRESIRMIAVQMGEQDIVDIGRGKTHGLQLIANCLSRADFALIDEEERDRTQRLDLCRDVVLALRAHAAGPSSVKENSSMLRLNKIAGDGKPEAVFPAGGQACCLEQVHISPEGKIGANTYFAGVKDLNFHSYLISPMLI